MDKQNKLSSEELEQIDGGKLFVSVDGGEKTEATVRCCGGKLCLEYYVDGKKKRYNTGYDLSGKDVVGNSVFFGLIDVQMSEKTDYTYNIDTKE